MAYGGLFYAPEHMTMAGLIKGAGRRLGRHAVWADNAISDGGAVAFACGHLRNAKALAHDLRRAGMKFTDAPTNDELALAAYRQWGTDYPLHLEGPIASGVIDCDAKLLMLSADRMGECSVYYTYQNGAIGFADHIEPLLESGVASRSVDADGLRELFGLGPAMTPGMTPFRDIRLIPSGTTLVATEQGHALHRYFNLGIREHEHDERQTIAHVRHLLEQAMDDLPTRGAACMLSGGLDSTILAAMLEARSSAPISSWSVDYQENERFFENNGYQIERDRPYIDQAVELLGADHHLIMLNSKDLVDSLYEAMALRGLPGMGDIDSSLLLFAKAIGAEHSRVISGECADEVFGGYPWFVREDLINKDGFAWSGSMALRERILKPSLRDKLQLSRYVCDRYRASIRELQPCADGDGREARLIGLHGLCMQWFMPNLQRRAQYMCAGAGLQVLTPYCDDRLAQYVYNVPWAMKQLGGQEKGLLRAAARDLLPDALLYRKKSPYPKTNHPQYAALMRAKVRGLLRDGASPILALIDRDEVERICASELRAVDVPWFGQLMAGAQLLSYLAQLNDWMVRYRIEIVD